MASYIDGFVIPIQRKDLPAYKKIAREAKQIWRRFGALDYRECVLDDATPPHVVCTFPKLAKMKQGETVVFAYIVFKSKAHRNKVNREVMAYFDKKYGANEMPMPFDMKRFAYGGFTTVVE